MKIDHRSRNLAPQPVRTSWPGSETVDIRCPRCGKRACWDEPFTFYLQRSVPPAMPLPAAHRWGPWLVVEKYPSILRWVPPEGTPRAIAGGPQLGYTRREGYYVMRDVGVVRCSHCHFAAIHRLNWPQDAYFQWDIRGYTLWAWSVDHAHVLLAYLGGNRREATDYATYAESLWHLPKEVMTAKVRPLIVKRITKTLADTET